MSTTVRPYRRGGWEVDIIVQLPDGSRHRERTRVSHSSKSAARTWGHERERHLMLHGPGAPKKEVPTLTEFAPEVRGRAHAGESSEAERDRQHAVDPEVAPDPRARRQASRRDHERAGAEAQARVDASGAQDGQQRLDAPEHAAEEGCRVERTRSTAVHHQVVEEPQDDDGVSRLRGVRAVAGRGPESKSRKRI